MELEQHTSRSSVCKCNCAWRENALEYFADLLAKTVSSFGIPFVSPHLLRHATNSSPPFFPPIACTGKGKFNFREKHAVWEKYAWSCSVSVYILGTKQRIVSFKSSVFHQVPPPGEILGGVISSPFGWRSGQPLCLFCEGVSLARMCRGPAELPSGKVVSWQRCAALLATTQNECFFGFLRDSVPNQRAWAELGFCSTPIMFRHILHGRPQGVLSLWLHSQCSHSPWGFSKFLTLSCVLLWCSENLVIDLRFKSGMGNEETQISPWVLGSQHYWGGIRSALKYPQRQPLPWYWAVLSETAFLPKYVLWLV